MNKILTVLVCSLFVFNANAGGSDDDKWSKWSSSASSKSDDSSESHKSSSKSKPVVPAGTASYAGTTTARITDTSSGSKVISSSTGNINMDVTFSGTGKTRETGSITGLTGDAGAAIGDLNFTAKGKGKKFEGKVTSLTYPKSGKVGKGEIEGNLSAPVVSGTTVEAPTNASGKWEFKATKTLKAKGSFTAAR